MNLEKLYIFQKEQDTQLENTHKLHKNYLLPQKLLALQVKIGELANETKSFKFWLNLKSIDSEKLLNKFLHCLHILISIGLDKGYIEKEIPMNISEYELTEQFLNLYVDMNDFTVCLSKDHYLTLFEDLLALALSLGFNDNDLEENYIKVYI